MSRQQVFLPVDLLGWVRHSARDYGCSASTLMRLAVRELQARAEAGEDLAPRVAGLLAEEAVIWPGAHAAQVRQRDGS